MSADSFMMRRVLSMGTTFLLFFFQEDVCINQLAALRNKQEVVYISSYTNIVEGRNSWG